MFGNAIYGIFPSSKMSPSLFREKGSDTSASVENITHFGIWIFVSGKEYFLNFEEYPFFANQTVHTIQNVRLMHGYHLCWPDLDVDLEIDNLENPEKYPLKFKK